MARVCPSGTPSGHTVRRHAGNVIFFLLEGSTLGSLVRGGVCAGAVPAPRGHAVLRPEAQQPAHGRGRPRQAGRLQPVQEAGARRAARRHAARALILTDWTTRTGLPQIQKSPCSLHTPVLRRRLLRSSAQVHHLPVMREAPQALASDKSGVADLQTGMSMPLIS